MYTLTKDWTGNLYCGITLEWDYVGRTIDISMLGYIRRKLQEYKHITPKKLQTYPYSPEPKKFGAEAQAPHPPRLDTKTWYKRHQTYAENCGQHFILCKGGWYDRVNGPQFHRGRADNSNGKHNGVMHPTIGLLFRTCGCKGPVPRFQHDLQYSLGCLLSFGGKSPQQGMWSFFHGVDATGWQAHSFDWSFPCQHHNFTFCYCLRCWSAIECPLPQLPNGGYFWPTLTDMGHLQPKTLDHCDNATAVGIANNTNKQQRSHSMEMRFFWIGDKIAQQMNDFKWHPGQKNLANYQSKHHISSHHAAVRPWYLHLENSPWVLPRVKSSSALKGCVGTLKDGYVCKVPLPRAPRIQHASHITTVARNTCYLAQVPRIPTWSDLTRSLAGLGRRTLLPFSFALM